MKSRNIINILNKQELEFQATRKDLSLLFISGVGEAYTKLIKKYTNFSYDIVFFIFEEGNASLFLDMIHINNEMKQLIDKKEDLDKKLICPAIKINKKTLRQIKLFEKLSLEESLKHIHDMYPQYLISLGLCNLVFRYVGNDKKRHESISRLIDDFGKKRNEIAKTYPLIEKEITKNAIKLEEKYGINGELLKYLTLCELNSFILTKNLPTKMINELEKRRKGYLYILTEKDAEQVITDKKLIKDVKRKFFNDEPEKNVITGHTAYPGKVKGIVFKAENNKKVNGMKDFILVKSMTLPEDTSLIDKCAAIVTDEGGLTSHVAIIARELQKPCIIGTKIATRVLKDGDLVEVDATKGIVKIIK